MKTLRKGLQNYCPDCDWHIGWISTEIPAVDDDAGWANKAVAHRKNCKWIHTRAGQNPLVDTESVREFLVSIAPESQL